MEVPALQVYVRVFHWNREPAAQEPSDSKSLKLSSKTGNLKFPVLFFLRGYHIIINCALSHYIITNCVLLLSL